MEEVQLKVKNAFNNRKTDEQTGTQHLPWGCLFELFPSPPCSHQFNFSQRLTCKDKQNTQIHKNKYTNIQIPITITKKYTIKYVA